MCRKKILALAIMAFVSAACLYGTLAWSIPVTNVYNRHNMSSGADDSHPHAKTPDLGGTDRICVFCHTPHSATPESTLWSRPEPETATFDLYAGRLAIKDIPTKSQYNSPTVTYPNGASRMCMSCHDGATAIGAVIGQSAEIQMTDRFITGSALVDLSKSHPISFVWDSDVYTDVQSWHSANGTTSVYTWPPNYNVAPLDGNSKMQCTTCHDPHEDPSRDINGNLELPPNDFPPFWRHTANCTPPSSSADCYNDVCIECHAGLTPPITPPDYGTIHNSAVLTPYP